MRPPLQLKGPEDYDTLQTFPTRAVSAQLPLLEYTLVLKIKSHLVRRLGVLAILETGLVKVVGYARAFKPHFLELPSWGIFDKVQLVYIVYHRPDRGDRISAPRVRPAALFEDGACNLHHGAPIHDHWT